MTTDSDVKPSLFLHCETVYVAMRDGAQQVHEGDVPIVVWEGFFTRLMRDLDLAVPYYSKVRNFLMQMGCIKQLRRGGGTTPSQWELIKPPTMELWSQLEDKPGVRPGPVSNSLDSAEVATLKQRVNDLTGEVATLKENFKVFLELYNKNLKQKEAS